MNLVIEMNTLDANIDNSYNILDTIQHVHNECMNYKLIVEEIF